MMKIRLCEERDIATVCDIYNYYIENTVITFEEKPVSFGEMNKRFELYTKAYPWLVCEVEGAVVGYAYATKWKEREAYRNTVESTVYIRNSLFGKGYGKALYQALIDDLRTNQRHVLLGCIALPNDASVRLHEYFGFEKVAHFSEVGRKFERWVDVGYWQKIN
jgi:L-amino acid N-acyltransferase YncA